MTELALIKLTRPETATDNEALLSRIERMERRIGSQTAPSSRPTTPASPAPTTPADSPTSGRDRDSTPIAAEAAATASKPESDPGEELPEKPKGPALDVSFEQLKAVWPGLFGSLRDVLGARRWAYFREAVPVGVDGNIIILEVAHDFHFQSLQSDDAVAAVVSTRASDLLGGEVGVRFRVKEGSSSGDDEDEVDLNQLETRDDQATDPTALLAAELGAEVVED